MVVNYWCKKRNKNKYLTQKSFVSDRMYRFAIQGSQKGA